MLFIVSSLVMAVNVILDRQLCLLGHTVNHQVYQVVAPGPGLPSLADCVGQQVDKEPGFARLDDVEAQGVMEIVSAREEAGKHLVQAMF